MVRSAIASDFSVSTELKRPEAGDSYHLPVPAVLEKFTVSADTGLSDEEVLLRYREYGSNTIKTRRKTNALVVFVHQFHSPVVYLLAVAAALAFYFAEWEEGIAIAVVLAVNALIGFFTELRAARSIE
ncbi:MAG TPA: cation-transporting P-type ATPase, partial [Hyphomicrobiales bacterium]|nr:cation-transporting P-type ATPase [Hyphomicrobiales bacterium]